MGFGSNNNYFITNGGQPMTNISVAIEVTEDIVCLMSANKGPTNPAFTFQMNCYSDSSGPGGDSAWQQFVFTVGNQGTGAVLTTLIECWPSKSFAGSSGVPSKGDFINTSNSHNSGITPQATLSAQKLATGTQLGILLQTDGSNNVNSVLFTASYNGQNLWPPKAIEMASLKTDEGDQVTTIDLSPVLTFQLNLIGNNEGHSMLSSGAGMFTYSASNPVTADGSQPAKTSDEGTVSYETANSAYSELPTAASSSLTQYFSVVQYAPGGFLAATQQFGADNQTDIFTIGSTGQLMRYDVQSAGTWHSRSPIGPTNFPPAGPLFAPPGAALAVSQQFGADNQTDVFVVDNSGHLNIFSANSKGSWSGPQTIGPTSFAAPPGASLAASQQFGVANQTDVFVVDNSGTLNVFWVDGTNAWNGPEKLSGSGFAPPGASLAASQQFGLANQTDVFVVDNSGALNVFWVDSESAWNGPEKLSGPGFAPPGAPIAVSQQFGIPNQTDVFVVDNTGQVNVFWVVGSGGWNSEKIGPGADPDSGAPFAPPGAPIVACQQFGAPSQTDVFVVDSTGAVNVLWVYESAAWSGPLKLAPPGGGSPAQLDVAPGSHLAVSQQFGASNQTDVFLINSMTPQMVPGVGWPNVFWVQNSGVWIGPAAVTFQA